MAKEYRLSIIVTGKDSGATSMLSGIGSSLRSIGTIAGGILTSQVFTAIASQIGNMARSAFDSVATIQSLQMALTNLQARELIRAGDFEDMNAALRAAEPLAKATMDQLERIATLSPYQLQSVTNTYKMAMAFGYTSNEATVFTQALLNMSAGIGANGEMLDRMAYNLAQVRLQGKVTAVDIRQLAMAGFDLVDVLKYVGKQMGVNIKDHEDFNKAIENGQISWEDFTKYFAQYADENFGGASERMSRTLEGLKSTFMDVFDLTMPKVLGPLAEKVTVYLNDVLNSFMEFADSGKLEEWGQELVDFFNSPFFDNGFLGLTRGFEHWAQNVDWETLSQNLAAGIDSIDWALLGKRAAEGAGNIISGIEEIFRDTDWNAVFGSMGDAFMNFMAGLTGQESWENVKATWASNFLQLQQIVDTSMRIIEETGMVRAASIGAAIPLQMQMALSLGTGGIVQSLWQWVYQSEAILETMRRTFRREFDRMVNTARNALEEGIAPVVEAVTKLIDAATGALKPINIMVTLPNFEALAAAAADGMAALNAALSGGGNGGGSSKGAQVGGGAGSYGGGGGTIGGGYTPYAGGGIASGPKSGYPVTLHGTEAVIPLKNGNVPVEISGALLPSMGRGGTVIQVVLNYQPMISTASAQEAAATIAPIVADTVRFEFQKRGF